SSGTSTRIPESIGRTEPPAWARSLPLGFAVGPGEAFDEFSASQGVSTVKPVAGGPALFEAERPAPATIRSLTGQGANPTDMPTEETARPEAAGDGASDWRSDPAATPANFGHASERKTAYGDGESLRAPLKAIQVHDSYLIAETGDGMMVIDQHALHERILYEELRSRLARGQVESQRLLAPDPVDVTPGEAALILEHNELLVQLRVEAEPFGGDTLLVRSIPAMLPHLPPNRLVHDLAEHLRTQPLPPTRDGLLAELLHMVACKAAIKAGDPLSPPEIAALLERRHLVADSHHCPHGRPTALVFTKADLEKQFGRT